MSYQSMEEAKLRGEKENIPFWKAIQLEDAQERDVKIEDSWGKDEVYVAVHAGCAGCL